MSVPYASSWSVALPFQYSTGRTFARPGPVSLLRSSVLSRRTSILSGPACRRALGTAAIRFRRCLLRCTVLSIKHFFSDASDSACRLHFFKKMNSNAPKRRARPYPNRYDTSSAPPPDGRRRPRDRSAVGAPRSRGPGGLQELGFRQPDEPPRKIQTR